MLYYVFWLELSKLIYLITVHTLWLINLNESNIYIFLWKCVKNTYVQMNLGRWANQ